jgi:hypothetical protein
MQGRQTHKPENLPLAHPSLLDPLQRRTFDALQHKHAAAFCRQSENNSVRISNPGQAGVA